VLSTLGRVPSSRLAAELGMTASSVTRLAGRLEAAGLGARGADPRNRSIVTLEVTAAGLDLVARVVERRLAGRWRRVSGSGGALAVVAAR
jgi:DNA-binding MarR family transcriptional regulator